MIFALATLLAQGTPAAQAPSTITVPLRVVHSGGSAGFRAATLRDEDGRPVSGTLADGARYTAAIGSAHGVQLTGLPRNENAFLLRIDRDDDGDFDEEAERRVRFGENLEIEIERKRGPGVVGTVRYQLRPSRRDDGDSIAFIAKYAAAGTFEFGGRKGRIEFQDGLCDGAFDRLDFETGTTVTLDRNGDGKVTDSGEILYGSQIIEFAGTWFVIDELAADGSWVRFRESALQIPQLNQPFPERAFTTPTGAEVPLRNRPRPVLFMLWASW